ncbi:MAG: tetratricopeptide repeat protein [FCB group bacterium]|nr:tetratricopeptide repeat protein [FCB group bacterium]
MSIILFEIGRVYTWIDNLDKASHFLNKVNLRFLHDNHLADYWRAMLWLFIRMGKYKSAIKMFKHLEDYDEDDVNISEIYCLRGFAYYKIGKKDEARRDFKKALKYPIHNDWVKEDCEQYLTELEEI